MSNDIVNPLEKGKKLVEMVMDRNPDFGGDFIEISGAQGTSKTSCLLTFLGHTLKNHPKEKAFFREQVDAPLQIFKLGIENFDKIDFLFQESANVVFRDRADHLKELDLPHKTFTDFEDLWKKSKRGHITIPVFNKTADWLDFLDWLRNAGEWVSIYIDEFGDIAPSNKSGDEYARLVNFANTAGAFRRCMMKVFYTTQTADAIFWMVRSKLMTTIQFRGSKAIKKNRVTQKAIDNLAVDPIKGNQAWIERSGEFGRLRFVKIHKPVDGIQYEVHRNGPQEDGKEETSS